MHASVKVDGIRKIVNVSAHAHVIVDVDATVTVNVNVDVNVVVFQIVHASEVVNAMRMQLHMKM